MDEAYVDETYVDQPPAELTCPTCGTVNPGTRRYCGHCGYSFVAAYGTDPYVDWSAWTPQAMAARDREAAREYRRSLPPLYRWRRVIIGALVFVLFVGFGAVLQLGPVALAQDGWHRLAKQYVAVSGVQVMVNPTTASAPDSNPHGAGRQLPAGVDDDLGTDRVLGGLRSGARAPAPSSSPSRRPAYARWWSGPDWTRVTRNAPCSRSPR